MNDKELIKAIAFQLVGISVDSLTTAEYNIVKLLVKTKNVCFRQNEDYVSVEWPTL